MQEMGGIPIRPEETGRHMAVSVGINILNDHVGQKLEVVRNMETIPTTTTCNLQAENPTPRPFEEYHYTKEIMAGRIRGELAIHQTEIKTDDSLISALGFFFKPAHSETEISLGLAPAPIQISPNIEELNIIGKVKALLKTLYRIRVLLRIEKKLCKKLCKKLRNIKNITKAVSSFPHVKKILYIRKTIVHFQTGYPGYTLARFIEELSDINEEEMPASKKRVLVLAVFKKIFTMLDNLPRRSHGDFHPTNILVSVQHTEPEANSDQPIYTPSEIRTFAIDIGSIHNIISPNLKGGKLFYTKQDDLRNLFTHLERWWSPQLNKLLGITQLTRERVMQMLEQQDQATQQRLLSDAVQDYQLQRLSYLLNTTLGLNIKYTKEELQVFSETINKVYEIDGEGKGAPTVIMPYATAKVM